MREKYSLILILKVCQRVRRKQKKQHMKQMAHLMCSILMDMINWKGSVSLFTGVLIDLVRKLIGLFVSTTNNDPLVVANLCLKAITNLGRTPNTLRVDLGTENVYCEELQVFFTKNSSSFLYVSSTRN